MADSASTSPTNSSSNNPTVTMTYGDDGKLIVTMTYPDGVNTVSTPSMKPIPIAGGATNLLDNAAKAQQELAMAEQPSVPDPKGNFFSTIWDSTWGKWVLVGALSAATILLIVKLTASHSSRKNTATPVVMTARQATLAQAQLDKQLSNESQVLKAEGYSADIIAQSRNQVEIVDGTQIALATIASGRGKNKSPLFVTGSDTPEHYASLANVNTRAYAGSLSVSPSQNDMTQNTAAVHGLSTGIC